MSQSATEQQVDVRPLPPRLRHSTIFTMWHQLPSGSTMLLVNDHDPLPLYFQFACEHAGRFRWEYVEQGPDAWRVRITKGEHLDPGFVPKRKPAPLADSRSTQPLVVDTRPIFHRGESPCVEIDDAVSALKPGQTLVLLVPFEPVPLYMKLGAQGFAHTTSQEEDGTWRVEFRR